MLYSVNMIIELPTNKLRIKYRQNN